MKGVDTVDQYIQGAMGENTQVKKKPQGHWLFVGPIPMNDLAPLLLSASHSCANVLSLHTWDPGKRASEQLNIR